MFNVKYIVECVPKCVADFNIKRLKIKSSLSQKKSIEKSFEEKSNDDDKVEVKVKVKVEFALLFTF